MQDRDTDKKPEDSQKPRTTSMSRADWIDAAWKTLGQSSLDHVRVDRLARDMDVTRGSFYWHFKNRDDLIAAVLERWFDVLGLEQSMIPAIAGKTDPQEKLWTIYERVINGIDGAQYLVLRLWARNDPKTRDRLADEDARRLSHLVTLFAEIGFATPEAARRGAIYQSLMIGEYLRQGHLPQQERLRLARLQHEEMVPK